MLTFGSLFAGIGGFDRGLESAGMRCLWQCELDPYAIRVLEKHWPDVLRVRDVRDVGTGTVPYVDVVCGGFPCQDVSTLGAGGGLDGARSGLWFEMFRVVCELRPRYVIVENVPALLARGVDRVLGSLASIGYDAEWDCIPASAVGAPHQRDRVWLVAYPSSEGRRQNAGSAPRDEGEHEGRPAEHDHEPRCDGQGGRAGFVADANGEAGGTARTAGEAVLEPGSLERPGRCGGRVDGTPRPLPDANGLPPLGPPVAWRERSPWRIEPDVGRVAHGVPARTHRLRVLGNAVVPQVVEWIGRRIIDWEGGLNG